MQKINGKRLAFEMLFALALLLLLIAILVNEISRTKDAYFYERADLVTYTPTDALYGYVFRNEIAPNTLNNGPIDYRVADGTAVQAGQDLAFVYRDDTGTDKRERAAALYAKIAELEETLRVSDGDWKNGYISDYTALMCELSTSDLRGAKDLAQSTATAIGARNAQTARESIQARIDALKAELDALTAHANDYLPAKATESGTFYHRADGYEALFGINQIEHLTPAALNELLAAQPKLDTVIGKLVCHGTWYFAVPTDRALTAAYTKGNTYQIRFPEGSTAMRLDRIYTDDTDSALLIFCGEESPAWLSPERRQSVTVERESVTALCVPADALSAEDTLFVLCDGVAQQRRVTPVLRERGVVLVLPFEENALDENEYVIVSTKQLFDGKVLK